MGTQYLFKKFSSSMIFRRLWLILLAITPFVLLSNFAGISHAADGKIGKNASLVSTSILSKVPSDKATVGVIPYYIKDHQVYILLGRERIDGDKKERAGKFSDFGGSVELDGTSFAHNAIRELKEETMGQVSINEKELYENGSILCKVSSKNRDIIYVFYPMSEQEYKKTRSLSSLWPALCSHKKDSEECEKDQFTWFNVQDITNKSKQVRDIDGNSNIVPLREYFVQDCVEHPNFSKILEQISYVQMPNR
jgi:hypothetical protein